MIIQLHVEKKAYVLMTNILGISRNKSKDCYRTIVSVFGIKVDTSTFTARLLQDKLEKAIKKIEKALNDSSNSTSYFIIQSLVGFHSFYFQVLCLGRVFIQCFWDFINHFPHSNSKTIRKKISS